MKIMIPHRQKRCGTGRALHDDAGFWPVRGLSQRAVQGGRGWNGRLPLKAATGDDDDFRGHIINPARQFRPGVTGKHHHMYGPDPRAGQHGDGGLDHGRHGDQHAVALPYPQRAQATGKPGHPAL